MIQGNDCIFQIDLGAGYLPILCGKSFTLTLTTEIVETTTKGDGQYLDFDYNSLSYSITINGLSKIESYSSFDVIDAQKLFQDVPFQLIYTESAGVRMIEGTVIIMTSDLTATAGAFVDFSHEFKGRGAFAIYSTATPCMTTITALSVSGMFANVDSTSGDWTSFSYTVDGSPFTSSTASLDLGTLAEGSHTLVVTPYCSSTEAGTPYTKTFDYCALTISDISYYLSYDPIVDVVKAVFMYNTDATSLQYLYGSWVTQSLTPPVVSLNLAIGFFGDINFRPVCSTDVYGTINAVSVSVPGRAEYSPTNNSSVYNYRDTELVIDINVDGAGVVTETIPAKSRFNFNYAGTYTAAAIQVIALGITTSTYRIISQGAITGTTATTNPFEPNTINITGANIDNGFLIAIW